MRLNPRHKLTISPIQTCKGSSIVETAVFAAVITPIMIAIPLMGKIGDINSSAAQGSRYTAWEQSVTPHGAKTNSQVLTDAQNILLGDPSAPLLSGSGAYTDAKAENNLWSASNNLLGDKTRLMSKGTQASLNINEDDVPGIGSRATSEAITGVADLIGIIGGNKTFDVNEKGLFTGHFSANINSNAYLRTLGKNKSCDNVSYGIFSCVQRQNAILADTWASGSPEQAATRTKALVPTQRLELIAYITKNVGDLPLLEDLGTFEEAPGYVAPDVIPADRLGPQD